MGQLRVASTIILAHNKALEILPHLSMLVSLSMSCNTYNYPYWGAARIVKTNFSISFDEHDEIKRMCMPRGTPL